MPKGGNTHYIDTDQVLEKNGKAECFYCDRIMNKDKMVKVNRNKITVYLCPECKGE